MIMCCTIFLFTTLSGRTPALILPCSFMMFETRFLILNICYSSVKCSRMRLDQLSTDYRSTVLQLIQLRCRLCHFLGLSVGGTGSATCDRSTAVLGDGHCRLISSSFCDGSLAYTVAGGSCSPNDNSAGEYFYQSRSVVTIS